MKQSCRELFENKCIFSSFRQNIENYKEGEREDFLHIWNHLSKIIMLVSLSILSSKYRWRYQIIQDKKKKSTPPHNYLRNNIFFFNKHLVLIVYCIKTTPFNLRTCLELEIAALVSCQKHWGNMTQTNGKFSKLNPIHPMWIQKNNIPSPNLYYAHKKHK